MRAPICYPDCRWLDPTRRDGNGSFWCEWRERYVAAARTVYTGERRSRLFHADRCAADCWHRGGKTPVPTL